MIYFDPQCLERPLGRVASRVPRGGRDGAGDDVDEARRGRERGALALRHDGARDAVREALLAVPGEDLGDLLGRGAGGYLGPPGGTGAGG